MTTHLFLLLACTAPSEDAAEPVSDLRVAIDETIPTLVRVSWESESTAPARVRWWTEDAEGSSRLDQGGRKHDHAFLGIPAGETGGIEVVEVTDDGERVVAEAEVTLDVAPSSVPQVEVVQAPDSPPTPYLFVVTADLEDMGSAVQIVDWQGRPIWWRPDGAESNPFASPTLDGGGVLFTAAPETDAMVGVARMEWDGTSKVLGGRAAHHEIHELPDGSIGYCSGTEREIGGQRALIDELVVLDPQGETRVIWDASAWFDPEMSTRCDALELPDGVADGTHCNGIAYDERRHEWIVSLYCRGVIVGIDEATGTQLWSIGNAGASLNLPEEAQFNFSHSPRIVGDELWFFDNGSFGDGSRTVAVHVDAQRARVEFRDEWAAPRGQYTPALGSVHPYGGGGLVSFGVGGGAYWHDASGEVLAELAIETPAVFSSVSGIELPVP